MLGQAAVTLAYTFNAIAPVAILVLWLNNLTGG